MPLLRRLLVFAVLASAASLPQASPQGVVISQVYGGGGNSGATLRNDYVELFNAGATPVSLAGWSVQYASSTGSSWQVTPLTAWTLLPGQYYLVQQAAGAGGTQGLPTADAVGSIPMSGTTGKVALASTTTAFATAAPSGPALVDLVGWGTPNAAEGTAAPATSNTLAIVRAANGCSDTDSNVADFATAAPQPRNTASPLAPCGGLVAQPIVPSCPAAALVAGIGGSVDVSASDADSRVDAASLNGTAPAGFTLGAFTAAPAAGASATQRIDVAASTAPGSYNLALLWRNDAGQTASCNLSVTLSGLTPIPTLQGGGASSPFVGQTVTTRGVVTRVNNNGFFLQDPLGDGDPATSDAVFVFTSSAPAVSAGQLVQLTATVAEFNVGAAGNAATLARPLTELTSPTAISVLASGYALAPVDVVLPLASVDEFERYEGMLVTLRGPLTVSQNFFLGRFGQLTLSAGGRLETPTNRFRPGPGAAALADANARATLLLDDGTSQQNPNPTPYLGADNTVRAGDLVESVTGVIDFGLATADTTGAGLYRIHPTQPVAIARANPRPTAPVPVGGNLRVASANVLNFFTTFTDGTTAAGGSGQGCALGGAVSAANCRGANGLAEFQRQRAKIVELIGGLDADIVGLMEVQNNGATAVQNLVDGLNARLGAGTYARVADPATGTGTDAIKVAMIYRPARVTPAGPSLSDNQAIHNRPPLAQTFVAPNGERLSVIVNHFKSKGCDGAAGADLDQGDGQGCFNDRRLQQAQALRGFVGMVQAATGTTDALLIGDFNAYAKEDPVVDLTAAGFVDAIERFNAFGYSYVFDGAAGRLDHAFATPSLAAKLTGATDWHVNADEPSVIDYNTEFKQPACAACGPDYYAATPYRASDHDPALVGLAVYKVINGTAGRDTLLGTPGDDRIYGGEGADTLTGNGGRDIFAYRSLRDAGDTITDFVPGASRLDLIGVLAEIGADASTAIPRGVVRVAAGSFGAQILIDADGVAGPVAARVLVTLRGVPAATLDPSRDLILR